MEKNEPNVKVLEGSVSGEGSGLSIQDGTLLLYLLEGKGRGRKERIHHITSFCSSPQTPVLGAATLGPDSGERVSISCGGRWGL